MLSKYRNITKMLGPGLLYAGAAVGVSHLVQSTRAGANYGYDLLWVLILAHVIKYPFFEFGTRYAAATGQNLIEGYRQLGKWAVILFLILTVCTMFAIQAAVTIVTAGLVGGIFNLPIDPVNISIIILSLCIVILIAGKYSFLDKTIKFVIFILAVSTIVAAITALSGPTIDYQYVERFSWLHPSDILFLIAFAGWMPSPIDVTVWQSLWTVEKRKAGHFTHTLKSALLDFRIGYIGTAFLALCFLVMGKEVLYGTGKELSPSGLTFATQLIEIYTGTIGSWSYYFIAAAALTTMISTTLTCLDAYPRVMKPITRIFIPQIMQQRRRFDFQSLLWSVVVAGGAILLLGYLSSTMQTMVDIATTLSFVTAPVLAALNYLAVTDKQMPSYGRPARWLKVYAVAGIVLLTGFTAFFLYWRFIA